MITIKKGCRMKIQHRLMHILLIVQVAIVVLLLLCGAQGFIHVGELKDSLKKIDQEVALRMHEIEELEQERDAWLHDSFYVERYAREKLGMSRDNETLYKIV